MKQQESHTRQGRESKAVCRKKAKKKRMGQSKGPWSEDEHKLFVQAIEKYGNSWTDVGKYVKTRTGSQCCSHAQKHFRRIARVKAKEIKDNPETENYIFVVFKCYYNTTLIPKRQILSYDSNKLMKWKGEEKGLMGKNEGDREENELAVGKDKGVEIQEAPEDFASKQLLGNANANSLKENETSAKMEEEDISLIISPITCYPFSEDNDPTPCPPHYNPFKYYN